MPHILKVLENRTHSQGPSPNYQVDRQSNSPHWHPKPWNSKDQSSAEHQLALHCHLVLLPSPQQHSQCKPDNWKKEMWKTSSIHYCIPHATKWFCRNQSKNCIALKWKWLQREGSEELTWISAIVWSVNVVFPLLLGTKIHLTRTTDQP